MLNNEQMVRFYQVLSILNVLINCHFSKESCSSMGASSYRWFFDGCCQCVGSTCNNFGIDDSRCLECPETKLIDGSHNSLEMPNEDDLEFGEDMKDI